MKDKVLDILDELEDDVQSMREEGETDLRTVLHFISTAKYNVRALEDDGTVTISKAEYDRCQDALWKLSCLNAAGVDNWSGYDYAMEMYREEDE